MIKLDLPKQSYWLDLKHGVRLKVRPLTTPVYEQARFESQKRIKKIQEELLEAKAVGAELTGIPDLSDDAALLGFSQFLFVQCLAKAAVEEWEAVVDGQGNAARVTPHNIDDLMRIHTMADDFLVKYTATHAKVIVEGESSTAGANGTSAAAPDIAKSAKS